MDVLFVAFHYPPEVSGGVPRALITEEFLIERGCRVRVLTPQPIDTGARGADVLSVPLPGVIAAPAPDADGNAQPRKSAMRDFVRRWVIAPDAFVLWARRAVRVAFAAAAERPFDLVVTSSPPESMHAIGRRLKRRLGCAWLADFRDGWTFEPHRVEAELPVRRVVERAMERRVIREADHVTAATRPIADDLRARYPERSERIHLLPTGFQRPPVAGITPPDDRFHLVYTGRIALSHLARLEGARVFFVGLERALAADREFAAAFRLTMVGDYSDGERAVWRVPSLADHVDEVGPVPYAEALERAAAATMLLLLTKSGQASIATRKIFDYLSVDRPVFALAEGNEAARILDETRAGMRVSAADPDAVADGLLRAYSMWRDGTLAEQVPCDRTSLYEAEPLFERVIGERVLARVRAGS